jgi:elongation factor Tu
MSTATYSRALPNLNVGTIGHHPHGKTTLSAALTQVLAARYGGRNRALTVREIVKGGIVRNWDNPTPDMQRTIAANKLEYETAQRHYSHSDLPGLRGYYRNTSIGVSELDAVILVVAADSSVMAQSREHLLLAKGAGVSRAVVFINKCDLVSDETLIDLAESEARQVLNDCGFSGDDARVLRGAALPVLAGDVRWEAPVLALAEALDLDVPQPHFTAEAPAILEITEVPNKPSGVVAVGRLVQGTLRRGDLLQLLGRGGDPVRVKVSDLEVCGGKVNEGLAGETVGVLLSGGKDFSRLLVRRGKLLVAQGLAPLRSRFTAEIKVLTTAHGGRHTPFFDGHQVQLYLGADDVTANVRLPQWSVGIEPGATAQIEFQLWRPARVEVGRGFTVRDGCDGLQFLHGGGPNWGGTVGLGRVTQVLA